MSGDSDHFAICLRIKLLGDSSDQLLFVTKLAQMGDYVCAEEGCLLRKALILVVTLDDQMLEVKCKAT